jgi:hypothetical protein
VFQGPAFAALMKEEPRDELTALFVRKLLKAVREIAAKTAPEVLRRHDMMKSLDPETAAGTDPHERPEIRTHDYQS